MAAALPPAGPLATVWPMLSSFRNLLRGIRVSFVVAYFMLLYGLRRLTIWESEADVFQAHDHLTPALALAAMMAAGIHPKLAAAILEEAVDLVMEGTVGVGLQARSAATAAAHAREE